MIDSADFFPIDRREVLDSYSKNLTKSAERFKLLQTYKTSHLILFNKNDSLSAVFQVLISSNKNLKSA